MAHSAPLSPSKSPRLRSLSDKALRTVLAEHNPEAPRTAIDELARVTGVVVRTLSKLTPGERQRIPLAEERLRGILLGIAPAATDASPERVRYAASGMVEQSAGEGLGARIGLNEGLARLAAYAPKRPMESWAGPVAGAGAIEAEFGIPRSTLNEWHRRGVVLGLLRGERKRVYPLDQFVDGRPVPGLAAIARLAPDPRAAWLWLRQPHGSLDMQAPLDLLKHGHAARVATAAERDFG